MAEYGDVRASYEVDRLASLAAELGYARSEDAQPQRPAPGSVASDVQRYAELADELGLTASAPSTGRAFPGKGR